MTPSPIEVSLEEAAALVKSGDHVVVGCLAAEPIGLVRAVCGRAHELRDVTITAGVLLDGYPVLDAPEESFRFRTWLMPTSSSHRVDPSRVSFMPFSWSQAVDWLRRIKIDVAIVQVAPGPDGNYSLGTSVSYGRVAVDHAETVIGVVNPLMPYTFGDSVIPASALDVIVHDEAELPVLTNRPAGPRDRALAMSVAETIPDGALLQVGVGVLPDAVIAGLVDLGRRNLRQFSMLTDSFLELVKHRALTDEGPQAIVGEIVGSSALYDYVRENRRVTMADGRRTHAMKGLLERKGLVVLGSALEVDLLGQANLEVRGGAQFSGVGGAMDFGVAAATSQATADSVIMLHSATADGTSRIVPRLSGGMVSLPRTLVRRVVTEHGAAVLDSASARERAERLVAVADPAHRDELARHLRANPALFGA